MFIYIHKNEQQLGPFDESNIQEGLNSGQFSIDDLAWKEGLSEWVQLRELLKKPEITPPLTNIPQVEKPTIIQTNVKQGAVIGGWVCFALGLATMYFSMWTFFICAPLFLVAFILSIFAMVQQRIIGGIVLLLCTLVIPFPLSLYLSAVRVSEALIGNTGLENAKEQRAESDIEAIKMQLKTYEMLNSKLPSTEQGLKALVVEPTIEPIPKRWKQLLKEIPVDPWGMQYVYRNPSKSGNELDIFSYGPDKKESSDDIGK
jgi:general secretion pathway protein G